MVDSFMQGLVVICLFLSYMCVTARGSCAVQLISFHPSDALSQSHVHGDQHHGVLLCQCKCVKNSMMEVVCFVLFQPFT